MEEMRSEHLIKYICLQYMYFIQAHLEIGTAQEVSKKGNKIGISALALLMFGAK